MGQRGAGEGTGVKDKAPKPEATVRSADRHVVAQLAETAQQERYELVRFTMQEKQDREGVWHRQLTLVVDRELDDLESIF